MKYEAVQIVSKNDKHLEFKEKAYQRILEKNKDKNIEQLCVLSITGKARTGKSFLLSILLRFLTGMGEGDWMKKSVPLNEGFAWRGGVDSHTSGIWAWEELFTIPSTNGLKTGIMLLDTQGTHDLATRTLRTSRIFALSTLLSSIQVFNVTRDISLDDLQHLQLFISLANLSPFKHMNGDAGPPFQSLVFLVRDWADPDEYPFGDEGGEGYLEFVKNTLKYVDGKRDPRKFVLMEGIKSSFQKLSCYLMPSPGREMTENRNIRSLNIRGVEFLEHLEKLTRVLLADPVPKQIGFAVSPFSLGEYLKGYTALFSQEEFPEPRTIAEATAVSYNKIVTGRAIAKHEEKMTETVLHTASTNYNIKSLTETWKEKALHIFFLFLVYFFLANVSLYIIPFIRSILVYFVGELGVMLVHFVVFAIIYLRSLNF